MSRKETVHFGVEVLPKYPSGNICLFPVCNNGDGEDSWETVYLQEVTCGNCKRTKNYKEAIKKGKELKK